MFSQPSLPSSIMFEAPTTTEESADLASPPPSVSGNTLFFDVSENQDDVPSLGELFSTLLILRLHRWMDNLQ